MICENQQTCSVPFHSEARILQLTDKKVISPPAMAASQTCGWMITSKPWYADGLRKTANSMATSHCIANMYTWKRLKICLKYESCLAGKNEGFCKISVCRLIFFKRPPILRFRSRFDTRAQQNSPIAILLVGNESDYLRSDQVTITVLKEKWVSEPKNSQSDMEFNSSWDSDKLI